MQKRNKKRTSLPPSKNACSSKKTKNKIKNNLLNHFVKAIQSYRWARKNQTPNNACDIRKRGRVIKRKREEKGQL
jgi:hypothetical protein